MFYFVSIPIAALVTNSVYSLMAIDPILSCNSIDRFSMSITVNGDETDHNDHDQSGANTDGQPNY
jgi:hypothetical protein